MSEHQARARVGPLTWEKLAEFCAWEPVADALIKQAQLTPYTQLDGYMHRWWLFNPRGAVFPGLAAIRIHHILRPDAGPHPHNHPWDARTIILRGGYFEERDDGEHLRVAGDTTEIKATTFHRIVKVSEGGAWTMFITGPKLQDWGFRTAEGVIPWREYL